MGLAPNSAVRASSSRARERASQATIERVIRPWSSRVASSRSSARCEKLREPAAAASSAARLTSSKRSAYAYSPIMCAQVGAVRSLNSW